jgi:glycosyltransferase involved in cell wall biosynthesis
MDRGSATEARLMDLPARSVWIDAQGAQTESTSERGIPRHVVEITRAMIETAPEAVHSFGLNPTLPVPDALDHLRAFGRLGGVNRAPEDPPPIYHIPSPFESAPYDWIWPSWARSGGVRTVVTVHDLVPLLFPDEYLEGHPFAGPVFNARLDLIRSAQRVLAISESTATDVVERLGVEADRITVIDSGVSMRMASLVPSREAAVELLQSAIPRLRDRFVLYVGGTDWRKNMEGTISAYGLLPPAMRAERQLVIACKLDRGRRRELMAHAKREGIGKGELRLTGFVTDEELAALYRACELFLFPSLYEGAGLPVLEAMSCDAPVAASRTASVPEILGDLRATFDPSSPAEIASCLQRTIGDSAELDALRERSRRRAEHFTWGRVMGKTLEAYERVLSTPGRRVVRRRKQLAVFAPWPPIGSEEAEGSASLAGRLAAYADVDLIVPDEQHEPGDDRSAGPRIGLHTMAEFEWLNALRDYDHFLYVQAERILVSSDAAAAALRADGATGEGVARIEVVSADSATQVAERCAELMGLK